MIRVERSAEVPRSLVESTAEDRYRHRDVVDQLAEDFHEKCYICEIKPVADPQVEHRLPHKGGAYPDRKYDWNNLFYACDHCNTVKNKAVYDAGIIDCCVRDPEEALLQELYENDVRVTAHDGSDSEAVLTAHLIEEVFMSESTGLRTKAAAVRLSELQMRMNMLYTQLDAYRSDNENTFVKNTLVSLLRRERAFAGFVRSYVRQHADEYPELVICLN